MTDHRIDWHPCNHCGGQGKIYVQLASDGMQVRPMQCRNCLGIGAVMVVTEADTRDR